MVVAPSAMAAPTTSATKATSERVASSQENSTSSTIERASRTASTAAPSTWARSIFSLYRRWMSLVAMKVWMRGRSASRTASPAAVTSRSLARARPATITPGDLLGDGADGLEVARRRDREARLEHVDAAGARAAGRSRTFSRVLRWMPGDCSPSRSVVSKIVTRFAGSCC